METKEAIKEIVVKIEELERDITEFLQDRVLKFQRETGLTPTSIKIEMTDITNAESIIREYAVSRTEVEVAIRTFY